MSARFSTGRRPVVALAVVGSPTVKEVQRWLVLEGQAAPLRALAA
ncbi:hypothetical protein SAMN03159495_4588 [Pseudomonas sp. NFR16]|nr:hypothetical protein SAMN03159495_4588 [Pseudomonas sp. NFR16]